MKKSFITMIFLIVLAVPLAADDSDEPYFWSDFSVYDAPYISKKPVNGLHYLFWVPRFMSHHIYPEAPTQRGLMELLNNVASESDELIEKQADALKRCF